MRPNRRRRSASGISTNRGNEATGSQLASAVARTLSLADPRPINASSRTELGTTEASSARRVLSVMLDESRREWTAAAASTQLRERSQPLPPRSPIFAPRQISHRSAGRRYASTYPRGSYLLFPLVPRRALLLEAHARRRLSTPAPLGRCALQTVQPRTQSLERQRAARAPNSGSDPRTFPAQSGARERCPTTDPTISPQCGHDEETHKLLIVREEIQEAQGNSRCTLSVHAVTCCNSNCVRIRRIPRDEVGRRLGQHQRTCRFA